jgi:uncharacterized protein (TIGR02271 family)
MQGARVTRSDGQQGIVLGRIEAADRATHLLIQFLNGDRVAVAEEVLTARGDGTYSLALDASNAGDEQDASDPSDAVVIPVVAEQLTVEKRSVVRGTVRVHKRVETHEEVVDTPVTREEVIVERVPINTFVTGDPPLTRTENGMLVIPIFEEVVVIEKRLLLREEVRIAKRKTVSTMSEKALLQREVVEIERVAGDEATLPLHDEAGAAS